MPIDRNLLQRMAFIGRLCVAYKELVFLRQKLSENRISNEEVLKWRLQLIAILKQLE